MLPVGVGRVMGVNGSFSLWARITGLLAATTGVLIIATWPFEWSIPCRDCPNRAQVAGDALRFPAPGLVTTPESVPGLAQAMRAADGLTLDVRFRADHAFQDGPARIVSYSISPFLRNMTLGQERKDLILRLRTTRSGGNALDSVAVLPDAIRVGQKQHLRISCVPSGCGYVLDGRHGQVDTLAGGAFANWDPDMPIIFGNEATGDRPWRGEIYGFSLHAGALGPEPSLSAQNALMWLEFSDGAATLKGPISAKLMRPARYRNVNPGQLLRFGRRGITDYVQNFGMFLIFGVAAGFAFGRGARWPLLLMIVMVMPLLTEGLQMLQQRRTAALQDGLAGWAGGVVGVWLIWRFYVSGGISPKPRK